MRAITSESAAVTECYDYEPFGRLLSSSDNGRGVVGCHPAAPDTQLASRAPQKFTGKERDAEMELGFLPVGFYSAAQDRFLRPDPAISEEQSGAMRWSTDTALGGSKSAVRFSYAGTNYKRNRRQSGE